MFEIVIVSAVQHGKALVYSYRNISEIKSDSEYIYISNGTYSWRYKIDDIVSIVII